MAIREIPPSSGENKITNLIKPPHSNGYERSIMRYNILSDNNPSPLLIDTIGFGIGDEATSFGPKSRNIYIIHYVTKGKGSYNGNTVSRGQGFLIYPGQTVSYRGDPTDPWEFLWVISSDKGIEQIFERYNADPETLIFDYGYDETVYKIADIVVGNTNKTFDSLLLLELFLQIVNSQTYEKKRPIPKQNADIYLDFCINYIENNIHKKITVEDLTVILGVSQPYLYKLFHNRFNMSVKSYIILQKMRAAKQLLNETSLSVTEISEKLGYSDALVFSKAFKSSEGISPLGYKDRVFKK